MRNMKNPMRGLWDAIAMGQTPGKVDLIAEGIPEKQFGHVRRAVQVVHALKESGAQQAARDKADEYAEHFVSVIGEDELEFDRTEDHPDELAEQISRHSIGGLR